MIEKGLWVHKKIKKVRVFQHRERRSTEGELIQINGSPHDWFAHSSTASMMQPEKSTPHYLRLPRRFGVILFVKNKATFERVKARIIDERKVLRIELIRSTLRSLRSIDSTQLSRS